MQTQQQAERATPRDLFTVNQFSERRPAWSAQALRNLILNSEDRLTSRGEKIPGNGLAEVGAIVRVGRRVLIDEEAFFRWIAAEQQKRRKAA
jgi:hypothetical protein